LLYALLLRDAAAEVARRYCVIALRDARNIIEITDDERVTLLMFDAMLARVLAGDVYFF